MYSDPFYNEVNTKIDSGDLEVPVLPKVANRILQCASDPDSDAASLAQIIQGDQSMATHIMRVANSAQYCPSGKIVSLQQAIARLGMQQITEIALAISMNARQIDAPGHEKLVDDLWLNSLATAAWSKEIARITRRNVETAFLGGLFFHIGKPVVLLAVLDVAKKQGVVPDAGEMLSFIEKQHLRVGLDVAREWDLPSFVVDLIAVKQCDDENNASSDLALTVGSAILLADMQLANEPFSVEILGELDGFSLLNLYPEDLETLIEKTELVRQSMEVLVA